jgi:hypothetical protein
MTSPPTPQQALVLTTARAMYLAADGVPPTQRNGQRHQRLARFDSACALIQSASTRPPRSSTFVPSRIASTFNSRCKSGASFTKNRFNSSSVFAMPHHDGIGTVIYATANNVLTANDSSVYNGQSSATRAAVK